MERKKLGQILLERGLIDQDQLNSALAYQRQWGHRLGVALVAKGFITEGMLVKVLSEVMSLPAVDLSKVTFQSDALRMVTYNTCENNDLIPLSLEEKKSGRLLTLAMADPMNVAVIDEIEFTTGCKVRPVLAPISAINSAVRKHYRGMNTSIKPLTLFKDKGSSTGRMQLVRPGGDVEEVDTSTYEESVKKRDQATRDRVAAIKARRAQQIKQVQQKPDAEQDRRITSDEALQDYLREVQTAELESIHKLEKYFWALMRAMAKKGLISKDDFLRELNE
jgi:hypothetical protein